MDDNDADLYKQLHVVGESIRVAQTRREHFKHLKDLNPVWGDSHRQRLIMEENRLTSLLNMAGYLAAQLSPPVPDNHGSPRWGR